MKKQIKSLIYTFIFGFGGEPDIYLKEDVLNGIRLVFTFLVIFLGIRIITS